VVNFATFGNIVPLFGRCLRKCQGKLPSSFEETDSRFIRKLGTFSIAHGIITYTKLFTAIRTFKYRWSEVACGNVRFPFAFTYKWHHLPINTS